MHRRLSRRAALRTASSLLAAVSLPKLSSAATVAPLGIGQIGTRHAHAAGKWSAVRTLPDLWTIAGLVEPDATRRTGVFDGAPNLSEEELLARIDVRAVVIETTVTDACATAARCLRAGKHIHLDKPGALDHPSFRTMRMDAEARGLTVQMGYMLRYNPAFVLLFRAVKEGWLGDITEIDASMGKLAPPSLRAELASLPGGGMFELACHLIDAVVTILGKPNAVTALSTPTREDGCLDNQLAVLQYPRATATIRCNHADPFGGPRRRFSIAGTLGTIEIVPLESGNLTLSLSQPHDIYSKGSQKVRLDVPKDRYQGEFADLAAVVRGEKKLAWTAAHDIAVHETTLRAAGIFKATPE